MLHIILIASLAVVGINSSPVLIKRGGYPARIPNTEVFMINGTAAVYTFLAHKYLGV